MSVQTIEDTSTNKFLGPAIFLIVVLVALVALNFPLRVNQDVLVEQSSDVIATINGAEITRTEFQDQIDFILATNVILGQSGGQIDEFGLFNQMMEEKMLLSYAENSVSVAPEMLQQESERILSQLGFTRDQFAELLAQNGSSIRTYDGVIYSNMTIIRFIEDDLLVDVPVEEQQMFFGTWLNERMNEAVVDLDEGFLSELNQ
jgi:hypothetical protein